MMARRFVVRWHRVAAGPCLWLSVWLAAASASNCSRGGQTGDGSDLVPPAPTDTPAIATDLACAVREVVVEDFDARLEEVGFSARQLLDLAVQRADEAGPVAARWSPDGVVETQPESGLSSLELSFTDEAGKVVLLLPETGDAGTASDLQGAAEPVPVEAGSSRALQSFGCAPALVVEVDARLVSARGALDERFRARLVASVLDVISFDAELELGSLRGSLQVQLEGETLDEAQATLSGALTPYGSSGSLQASISSNLDDYVVVQNAMLLQWPPPEDCQDVTTSRGSLGTFRVTEDLPAPDFDAEVQALFSEVQLPLTWSDGSRTELSFAVIDSEPQCLSVNPADGAPALGYLATLRVDAQDGSWTDSFRSVWWRTLRSVGSSPWWTWSVPCESLQKRSTLWECRGSTWGTRSSWTLRSARCGAHKPGRYRAASPLQGWVWSDVSRWSRAQPMRVRATRPRVLRGT
jgi:hypothetical protein